jgi:hypothetical protein
MSIHFFSLPRYTDANNEPSDDLSDKDKMRLPTGAFG